MHKPEIISIVESQAEHELIRVTSQLTTVTQLTESVPSESTKSPTGSKLKRIISDPVQLTNPFTMSSVDPFQGNSFRRGSIKLVTLLVNFNEHEAISIPNQTPSPITATPPQPKARTKTKTPTPPPRRSLLVEPEPVCVRVKTPPLVCSLEPSNLDQVEIVEVDRIDAIKESIYQLEAELDSDHEELERQQRHMKLHTRHSLRQMKNEFMKKVRFPYLVKVMGKPTMLTSGQLDFDKGHHIIVSEFVGVSQRDGQKWFFGEHTGEFFFINLNKSSTNSGTGEKGIFPDDLVMRIVDDEPVDSTIWV